MATADLDDINVEINRVRVTTATFAEYDDDKDFAPNDSIYTSSSTYRPTTRRPSGFAELADRAIDISVQNDFLEFALEQDAGKTYSLNDIDEDDLGGDDPLSRAILHFRRLKNAEGQEEGKEREPLMIDQEDLSALIEEQKQAKAVQRWMRFDSVFGCFVAANAIIEGLSKEGVIDGKSRLSYIVSCCFCVVFIIELLTRLYFAGSFSKLMESHWNRFDVIIVTASAVDIWILHNIEVGGGIGLAIVRVVRLVRFVRLLRLLREVKTLWFLMQSWIHAMPYLLWICLFIFIICYTFGLLCYDLFAASEEFADDQYAQAHWGDLLRSILTLMQICTYDFGAAIIRDIVTGKDGKGYYALLFIFILSLVSLGLFNLMVGTVLTCCFELLSMDKTMVTATEKLNRHEALTKLEALIVDRSRNQIGATDDAPCISHDLIMAWLDDDTGDEAMKQLLNEAAVTKEDVKAVFKEISGIQGEAALIRVHDFVQGCLYIQSPIHDLEHSQFLSATQSLYSRICMIEDYLVAMDTVIDTAISQIYPGLATVADIDGMLNDEAEVEHEMESLEKMERDEFIQESKKDVNKELVKRQRFGGLGEADLQAMAYEKQVMHEENIWAEFDCFFLLVVCMNAVACGIDQSKELQFKRDFLSDALEGEDYVWLFIEVGFCFIFMVELVFRVALFYQLRVEGNHTIYAYIFPQVVSDAGLNTWSRIIASLPDLLREDRYVYFDILLIILAIIDNVVLRFFFRNVSFLILFRIFRATRLFRIARILYLWHDLAAMASTMKVTASTVLWNLLLLTICLYILAISEISLLKSQFDSEDVLLNIWASLSETFYQLWRFPTFSDWGLLGKELAEHTNWWMHLIIVFIAMFTGLGIMNVGTGIVIQQAFRFTAQIKRQHKHYRGSLVKKFTLVHLRTLYKRRTMHYFHLLAMKKERSKDLVRTTFHYWKSSISGALEKIEGNWNRVDGCISQERDLFVATMSVPEAKAKCLELQNCKGFSHPGPPTHGMIEAHFRTKSVVAQADGKWTTYLHTMALTQTFKPGMLGMEADWHKGIISKVHYSTQAVALGVQVGWKMLKVDGHAYNAHLLEAYKFGKHDYQITFDTKTYLESHVDGTKEKVAEEPKPHFTDFITRSFLFRHFSHWRQPDSDAEIVADPQVHYAFKDRQEGSTNEDYDSVENAAVMHESMGHVIHAVQLWSDIQREPTPVDEEHFTSHNLMQLLSDKEFLRDMNIEGIRPDLIIMIFQRLDVLRVGSIEVKYFVEGMNRLMFPVSGLDVASNKSVARRLYVDTTKIASDSARLQESFLDIACKLRGIEPILSHTSEPHFGENIDEAEQETKDEHDEIMLLAKESLAQTKNARLLKKIANMNEHISARIKSLEAKGDSHVGVTLGLEEGATPEDLISITSAQDYKD